ncbi:RUFY4 protein, partial [Atractosteus spatula]|nr:RUFY4 protein [Atractosteus spatula]
LLVCILNLQSEGGAVTDESPHLSSCCQLLEIILRKGLQQTVLGLIRKDYWHWLEQLPQQDSCGRLSQLSMAIEKTITCKKVITSQGRGRYFLRLALNRRILGNVVQHLLHTPKLLEWYDPAVSILRNEEFMEPFLSLLLVLSEMEFSLNIQNSSFLDESWMLPVYETYETVPCRELGMVLRYLGKRVFVLELVEGSQAHADHFVRPGDIIDEINGVSLRNACNGQAGIVLQRLKGKPLTLKLIRWLNSDGTVYRPMVKLLKALQQENPKFQLYPKSQVSMEEGATQCLRDGRIVYIVKYLGKADVGVFGGKEVLQQGIPLVLDQKLPGKSHLHFEEQHSEQQGWKANNSCPPKTEERPVSTVLFDLKETHVICIEKSSKQELFQHHYPEISCVGRYSRSDQTIFAFCVADCPETPEACSFSCVVMRASSAQECEEIVNRIGEC